MTNRTALYDWLFAREGTRAAADVRQEDGNEEFRLRPLAKEEIDLYVKRIDNSRLSRTVDNRDFAVSLGVSGGAALASIAIIMLLAPGVYHLLASRSMTRLQTEHAQLVNELRVVEAREAEVFNAHSMKAWKEGDKLIDPTSANLLYAPPVDVTASAKKQE